jgi:hydroxymethylpyrimidine kinase/phosphomethylpyrimidine kinase
MNMLNAPEPVLLTIAGFDPSGGAGVVADLKTFAAHGCYGVAAITAITVQNTQSVDDVHPAEPRVLQECLRALFTDTGIKAVKVGMLATRANAAVIHEILEANPGLPSVLDPLVRSTSGYDLIDTAGLEFVRDHLLSQASVVTPNLHEAAALTGMTVQNLEEMKTAAKKLLDLGARAVVVTGGHLERPMDVFADGSGLQTFAGDRVKPENIHGAGCTFSSAIAAHLGHGRQLAEAIVLAKAYVTEAIRKAYPVGSGRVPLNHFYRTQEASRIAAHAPAMPGPVH